MDGAANANMDGGDEAAIHNENIGRRRATPLRAVDLGCMAHVNARRTSTKTLLLPLLPATMQKGIPIRARDKCATVILAPLQGGAHG